MNPERLLLFCRFSYFDLPEALVLRLNAGRPVPLSEAARILLQKLRTGRLPCGSYRAFAEDTFRQLLSSKAEIAAYENDNAATGFVAYAIRESGRTVLVLRGSESFPACQNPLTDWRDNFCAPIANSVQYAPALRFAGRFSDDNLVLTGHSKGGNIALHTHAGLESPQVETVVFNAQGFGLGQASRKKLRTATNYITANDIVGALLFHPEKRIFVEAVPNMEPHSPLAYVFDKNGMPVSAPRSARSVLAEALSKAVYLLAVFLQKCGMRLLTGRILRCPSPIAFVFR